MVWVCKNFLANPKSVWALDAVYGNQDEPGGQFHLSGYTHSKLIKGVEAAGFHVTYIGSVMSHSQGCILLKARKEVVP